MRMVKLKQERSLSMTTENTKRKWEWESTTL